MMPMPRVWACPGPLSATAWPSTRIVPSSGWMAPARIFISVLLPAPFSPTRASTSPGAPAGDRPGLLRVAVEVVDGDDGDAGVEVGAVGGRRPGQDVVGPLDREDAHLDRALDHRRLDHTVLDGAQRLLEVVEGDDLDVPPLELWP